MALTCHAEDTTTGDVCALAYGHTGHCYDPSTDNIVYA